MVTKHEKQLLTYDPSFNTEPVPLVKIYTCGGLRIEVLQQPVDHPAQARYAVPLALSSDSDVQDKGISSAYTLLKMLISASKHFRSRDWIHENWHPIDDCMIGIKRLDNIASTLRKLFCPPYFQGKQQATYRRASVRCVSGSPTSGNGYALGAYPLIWIDVDAIDWNIEQACRMERFGDDAFPYWERAYHLASQGTYFPEELYSDWAEARRLAVFGSLRQSVRALARLSLLRYGERGQSEAIRMLWTYMLQFPTDEDALRCLMELLGWQERFQEVQQIFLRTQRHIEEEGSSLDARTVDIWNYLRTKHLSRQHLDEHPLGSQAAFSHPENTIPLLSQIAEAVTVGIVNAMQILEQATIAAPKNGSQSLETLIKRAIVASMGSTPHTPLPLQEREKDAHHATK